MEIIGRTLAGAPGGLWYLMIVVGLWSGLYDLHMREKMRQYRDARFLRIVGRVYVSLGVIMWGASRLIH